MSRSRDSLIGRALWPLLLAGLMVYVAADFVHYPVLGLGDDSQAAVRLTLVVPRSDETGREVAHAAARQLNATTTPTEVDALDGGSTSAVGDAFADALSKGHHLLAISTSTLADLAHDRREDLIPGLSARAASAQGDLAGAIPIGVLSAEPLVLAVPAASAIRSSDQLLRQMRRSPSANLFAIDDDTWTQGNLTTLVDAAQGLSYVGAPGDIAFSAYRTTRDAVAAVRAGDAQVILATRSQLRSQIHTGSMRELPWPAHSGPPARAWVALLAPASTSPTEVRDLRRTVERLTRDSAWRRTLRAEGRDVADVSAGDLRRFIHSATARADAVEARMAQLSDSGSTSTAPPR